MQALLLAAIIAQWDMAPLEPPSSWDQSPVVAARFESPRVPEPMDDPRLEKLLTQKPPINPAPKPTYGQCCCQGEKTALCFCLQHKMKCGCTKTTGSLWHLDANGNADRKVASGEPLAIRPKSPPKPVQQPAKPAPVAASKPTWAPGTQFWWPAEGRYRDTPQPGWSYPSVGVYANQVQTVAAPQPMQQSRGYWSKQCSGGQCRMVWVAS